MSKLIDQRIITKNKTNARRALMLVRCFELKIQDNKLSKNQKNKINNYFKHAKHLTNAIIGSEDIFNFDYKTKFVDVKWTENQILKVESRELSLPSQIKQDIKAKIVTDVANLSKKKKKGLKVGKLKFRKEVNAIGLKQYGVTWKFGKKNKLHIAGIGWVQVNGKDQISSNVKEFGCAKLIRKPTGYVIQVTAFLAKEPELLQTIEPKDITGLDFGIKDHIVLSNGEKHNFHFDTSKVIREQKRLSKKKKGSKNRFKQTLKLKKQYQNLVNIKDEAANKFVSKLKNQYKIICIQDENLCGWHSGLFGKQVQYTILGRIKSKLIKLNTTIVVNRFQPTTKLCPNCGCLNTLGLAERVYKCACGFSDDRDTKAARVIVVLGLKNLIPMEHRNFKPVEILTAEMTDKYQILFGKFKLESLKQEAPTL